MAELQFLCVAIGKLYISWLSCKNKYVPITRRKKNSKIAFYIVKPMLVFEAVIYRTVLFLRRKNIQVIKVSIQNW